MGRSVSIRVLLGIVGAMLLTPLTIVQLSDVRAAQETVRQADSVVDQLSGLDEQLSAGPAVYAESVTGVGAYGLGLVGEVNAAAASADRADQVRSLRAQVEANVDRLLAEIDPGPWDERLADLRTELDRGELAVAEVENEYEAIAVGLESAGADALESLADDAEAIGASLRIDELVDNLLVLTDLQHAEARQVTLWSKVVVPGLVPSTTDVLALADLNERVHRLSTQIENGLDAEPDLQSQWTDHSTEVSSGPNAVRFRNAVIDPFEGAILDGDWEATRNDDGVAAGAAPLDAYLDELVTVAGEFMRHRQSDRELRAGLFDLVVAEADEVRDHAIGERAAAVWNLVIFSLITLSLLALLGRFVAGPTRAMARTARKLSEGDLSGRVEMTGPTEVREAGAALNAAIDSLQLVEAQASALADGDLSDPELSRSAGGALGASLRTAVDRLTSALSLNETFRGQLAHEATHDSLTGLPNRKAIIAAVGSSLARAERLNSAVALLFLDLDGFKSINDTYGHRAGDVVLQEVGHRINAEIRGGDVVGRLGGDEFIVVAEGIDDISVAIELAERLFSRICSPLAIDGATIEPGVCIGVAMSTGGDLTPDELIHDADLAVYRAKSTGTSGISVCDEDLRDSYEHNTSMETAIREAIDGDAFELHYQPTLELASGSTTSLEALIRWDRGDAGPVTPAEFIPIAERSSLIVDIDVWVLHTAARQIEKWNREIDFGDRSIAVNISSRHLATGALAANVARVVATHDIRPEQLVIELTETAFVDDLDNATLQIEAVRRQGVRIALDDFGTGFMSLAVLRTLPVDILKIDRSFVARLDDDDGRALVDLIVNSGHILGTTITAEGVETAAEQRVLADMGVDVVQGYLFSRPLPAVDAARWLAERTTSRSTHLSH